MTGIVLGGGGASGTDVSATTAVETDVRNGKVFFKSDGSQAAGSMSEKAAAIIVPTTTDQILTANQFLAGAQTIKGDANLVAAKIKVGTTLFGITGTFTNDANATTKKILSGYSGYVNGVKVLGSYSPVNLFCNRFSVYCNNSVTWNCSVTVPAGFKPFMVGLLAKHTTTSPYNIGAAFWYTTDEVSGLSGGVTSDKGFCFIGSDDNISWNVGYLTFVYSLVSTTMTITFSCPSIAYDWSPDSHYLYLAGYY